MHGDPRFFAAKDKEGLLCINTRLIDTFLRWECGRMLLNINLFPNTQEISESMACLAAVTEHLCDGGEELLADPDVVALVVGDGRAPRTAALVAMRTKWQVVSIDPALNGLVSASDAMAREVGPGEVSPCVECAPAAAATTAPAALDASALLPKELPKELRHPRTLAQEQQERAVARRQKLRADLAEVARLSMLACTVEAAAVRLGPPNVEPAASGHTLPPPKLEARPKPAKARQAALEPSHRVPLHELSLAASPSTRIVLILPHAHVTPDAALSCVRFTRAAVEAHERAGQAPAVSVVQLPCCSFVWHDSCCGQPADVDYLDVRICASARAVRVWRDVGAFFDFASSSRGFGAPRGGDQLQRISASHAAKRRARRAIAEAREARRITKRSARLLLAMGRKVWAAWVTVWLIVTTKARVRW